MIAVFCLRLACGLLGCLLLLSPSQVNPRFYRTHFLTALGLLGVAAFFLRESGDALLLAALTLAAVLGFAGSIVWHVRDNPGGRVINATSAAVLTTALVLAADAGWLLADDLSSAVLLGAATTAMLMGHSYLIAPAMSLMPLTTLLVALGAGLFLRVLVGATGLWLWTAALSSQLETDLLLWLSVRWVIGILGPLVLGWMAWETARIRSTQSATGILYVVVILVFLGELTSQLLRVRTGYAM